MSASDDFAVLTDEVDYAMFIVTAAANGRRGGCLVGFSTQCSIDPLRYLVCLSRRNHTTAIASEASVLGVHVVTMWASFSMLSTSHPAGPRTC